MVSTDFQKQAEIVRDTSQSSFTRKFELSKLVKENPDAATDLLIELAQDSDDSLREEIARIMGELKNPVFSAALIKNLDDSNEYVLRNSIKSLGQIGAHDALEPLKELQNSSSYFVQSYAKDAIAKIEASPAPQAHQEKKTITTTFHSSVKTVKDNSVSKSVTPVEEEKVSEPESVESTEKEESPASEAVKESEKEPAEEKPSAQEVLSEKVEEKPVKKKLEEEPEKITVKKPVNPQVRKCIKRPAQIHAERLKLFFGDSVQKVLEVYNKVSDLNKKLPEAEKMAISAMTNLTLLHADKDDDLAEFKEKLESRKLAISKLKSKIKIETQNKTYLQRKAGSLMFKFLSLFLKTKKDELEMELDSIETKIKELSVALTDAEIHRKDAEKLYNDLKGEIDDAEKCSDEAKTNKLILEHNYQAFNEKLNKFYLKQLFNFTAAEKKSVLEKLAQYSNDELFFTQMASEMRAVLQDYTVYTTQMESEESNLTRISKRCNNVTNKLGEGISSGFNTYTQNYEIDINLSGRLNFKEESGFFSGYNGASGTASGSGKGEAVYTLQEIDWKKSDQMDEDINNFRDQWEALGSATASREYCSARIFAAQRTLDEYIAIIRSEVEQELLSEV